jgi:Fic family protein
MLQSAQLKENKVLEIIAANPDCSSKAIALKLEDEFSYATIKRMLKQLLLDKQIASSGNGKATKYKISEAYYLLRPISLETYFNQEIDERKIINSFNPELLKTTLKQVNVFSKEELDYLNDLQKRYKKNISTLSELEYKKELERLAIDLSWKSSQIEGNTYSLLETERLLKEKETADGKTKDEAMMLLNHKDAIDFIVANPDYIEPLTVASIEDIHSILIKDLDITRNIRKRKVGISGTNYQPLDNDFQIKEALQDMIEVVKLREDVFSKALLILVLLSYIQAFSDGNKRTARIISNAILMQNNYCPLSFRTVNSLDYKKAMLIFYEQNNIQAFKSIFIDQFEFAVNTYF